jgi:hypothetical protein
MTIIYIGLGVCLAVLVLILLFADKITSMSEMMSSFEAGAFKKVIIGLSIASILSLSFGFYANSNNQLPFLIIHLNGQKYTVSGDIGKVGYYAAYDSLVNAGEETDLSIVSWKDMDEQSMTLIVTYPSGKKVNWEPKVSKIDLSSLEIPGDYDKSKIKEIYNLSPYRFIEDGEVTIEVRDGEKEIGIFAVTVK